MDFNTCRNRDGSLNVAAINTFTHAAGGQCISAKRPAMVYRNGQHRTENSIFTARSKGTNDRLLGRLAIFDRSRGRTSPVNTSDHEWLVLTGNYSENFRPQRCFNIGKRSIGNVMAQSKDDPVRLNLFDGKVCLVSTDYETDVMNEGVNLSSHEQRINAIGTTLETNGVVSNPTLSVQSGVYGRDDVGKGYEFGLFANPSRSITLRFNSTTRENIVHAAGEDVGRYRGENVSTWTPHGNLRSPWGATCSPLGFARRRAWTWSYRRRRSKRSPAAWSTAELLAKLSRT